MSVAIIGLGQIGSSLGAALRKRRMEARVIGIVRRPAAARRALALQAVHEATTELRRAREADVVVMATPVRTILDLLPRVAKLLKPGTLVTDVGSTKADILGAARRHGMSFIGGHPMAGTEKAGVEGCDPELFVGRPWILVPAHGVRPDHVTWIGRMVAGVGAHPVWMDDPQRHDAAVAAISHVPYLAAYALLSSTDEGPSALAGNSFRDATRVAASDVDMVVDFLLTNRRHVPAAAQAFGRALSRLTSAVRRGDERALRKALEAARRRALALLRCSSETGNAPKGPPAAVGRKSF